MAKRIKCPHCGNTEAFETIECKVKRQTRFVWMKDEGGYFATETAMIPERVDLFCYECETRMSDQIEKLLDSTTGRAD